MCDETIRAVIQQPEVLASNQILQLINNKAGEVQIAIVDLIINVLEKCSLAVVFEEFSKAVSDNIDICKTVSKSFEEL